MATASAPFAQRWAILVGASSPVGMALAVHLAQQYGMHVVLHYFRNRSAVVTTRRQIRQIAPTTRTLLIRADLTRVSGIERLGGWVLEHPDVTDIGCVVYLASWFATIPWDRVQYADFQRAVHIHGWAPLRLVQYLEPLLRPPSRLIFFSDAGTRFGYPRYAAYTATKAVLDHWTRLLARALSPRVTVHAIAPYWIAHPGSTGPAETEQLRYGEPATLSTILQAIDLIMRSGGSLTGQILVLESGRGLG